MDLRHTVTRHGHHDRRRLVLPGTGLIRAPTGPGRGRPPGRAGADVLSRGRP